VGAYNSRVTANDAGEDVLHIIRTLARIAGLPSPIVARTSADLSAPSLIDFTEESLRAHSVRADHGGAAKGRLLYVASGKVVFAFLGVHVPPAPGPIICEAYATPRLVSDTQFSLMRAHLLAAAQELSLESLQRAGRAGPLAWATNDGANLAELHAISFQAARKPAHSDCDRTHYLEGSFG
jgi:hypothetical protein